MSAFSRSTTVTASSLGLCLPNEISVSLAMPGELGEAQLRLDIKSWSDVRVQSIGSGQPN